MPIHHLLRIAQTGRPERLAGAAAAVMRKFQRLHGLPATGQVDEETLKRLEARKDCDPKRLFDRPA